MGVMRAHRVCLHPVAALLSSAWLVACGGEDDHVVIPDAGLPGLEVPLGQSLPPLEYTLALDYERAPSFSPEALGGHLFLRVDVNGRVEGVVSARADGAVGLGTVTGVVSGTQVVLEWGEMFVPPRGFLAFDELRLSMLDDDGDGAIDGARGTGAGDWGAADGLDVTSTRHESSLIAALDRSETEATLSVRVLRDAALPQDELRVAFGEAVREADVRKNLRVRIGGDDLTGDLQLQPVNGFVAAVIVRPDRLLPFGAELQLDLGQLTDVAGNRLSVASTHVDVIGDPGAPGDNLGFESGLTGWFALGDASTQGAVDGVSPVEGGVQAALSGESTLGAAFDLSADATELELSITALSSQGGSPSLPLGVRLYRSSGEVIDIDTTPLVESVRECEICSTHLLQHGPLRLTASLDGLEAGPVVLEVHTFGQEWIVDVPPVFLIDDIQVR